VTAAHKLRIVRAWKENNAVVAMTGDGVNDAPAIKGADIGIAMGRTGTEVTKQASDMVITDDNFASIVAAVEQGRAIYDNIRKTLQYLLAGNCGELILMAVCVIAGLPAPLLPIHLLWINLVTDGLPALCLATDPIDPDVMRRRPRPRRERLADRRFWGRLLVAGVLTASVSFAVYLLALRSEALELARTHAFAVLVFAELLKAFAFRSDTQPVWRIRLLTNLNLALVVGLSFALQLWGHHFAPLGRLLQIAPISWTDCLMLVAVGAIPLTVLEAMKQLRGARTDWERRKGC
jgi:Ca2+-transporting ATPase